MREHIVQQIGNYRLLRLLGKSEFSEVYLAEHLRYGTRVALKALRTRLSGPRAQAFQHQVLTIARLKHSHIVSLTDAGIQQDIPYLVMEYAPGGTLRQRHPPGQRLDLPTVVGYVKQIAEGIQYAHEQRIAHLNLKPENILLDAHGTLVISDFSLPILNRESSSQAMAYMAPEQLQGRPHAASDQYALGILVYEWLSGEHPFAGQRSTDSLTPLHNKLPYLNPMVARAVHTALTRDHRQRFPSVLSFAEALESANTNPHPHYSTGALPLSQPTSSDLPMAPTTKEEGQERKPARKVTRRAVAVGLASLGVIGVAGGGTVWFALSRIAARGKLRTTYRAHKKRVRCVAWSADGTRILSCGDDHSVQIWNVDSHSLEAYKEYATYAITNAAWSPDNKRVACASEDQTVRVWDVSDRANTYTYSGHSGAVNSVSWSSNGTRIASASNDKTVQVWNTTDGGSAYIYRNHPATVYSAAWSPDNLNIASTSADKTVRIWNANSGSELYTYRGHTLEARCVAWSPDGKRIASAGADFTVHVWNPTDGGNVYVYHGHTGIVNCLVWSPDGQRILSASADHTVHMWNAADGSHAYIYRGHSAAVNSVSWSHDGMWIASASDDNTVQVWDAGWFFHIG